MIRRPTVLVVDDDAGVRRVLADGLGRQLDGFDIVTASDGREAIDALERQHVDALVTDLAMPVVDGFALLAYVANKRWALPVTVLSALSESESGARLADFDGLTYLRKPASTDEVADAVRTSLERRANGQVQGIPLAGVLQLVAAERRSCTLLVKAGRRTGRLYFRSGKLINAFSDDFGADGEAAARDILGWHGAALEFARLPDEVAELIEVPLARLLLEVSQVAWPTPGETPTDESVDGPAEVTPVEAPIVEAAEPEPAPSDQEEPAPAPSTAPERDPARAVLEAIGRLTSRAEAADRALSAVADAADGFREAHQRFQQATAARVRRRQELEAFRDEAQRVAHEILGRIDDLFGMAAEAELEPDAQTDTGTVNS